MKVKLSPRALLVTRILLILFVVGFSLIIFNLRDRVESLARYGYPGIFVLAFLSNATVLLPAPGIVVVFTMGAVFHPLGVALAAGAGGALGELSGYLAGLSGKAVVEQVEVYQRIHAWLTRHRRFYFIILIGLSAIPNPVFDLVGIASGAMRLPLGSFLLATFLGNTLKMLFLAYAGSYSLPRLFN